jgi:DNA polymerase III sliding clamp (beta) subunit (PCNA family)
MLGFGHPRATHIAFASSYVAASKTDEGNVLRLRFAEGELTVSARTQDVGEAQESLPAREDA